MRPTGLWIVGLGTLLSSLTPFVADQPPSMTLIPEPVIRRAEALVRDRIGEEIYREHVALTAAEIIPPSATCLKPDSECDPVFKKPRNYFEFSFRMSHKPFVDEKIWFSVDHEGEVLEPFGIYGIPDCAADPAECQFDRVDAVEAEKLAREHGLAAGVKYWKVDFAWYTPASTYVWMVTTTTEKSDDYAEGETLIIDANSADIIGASGWVRHSCGP